MSDKKKKNKNVVFELKKQGKDDSEFRKKVSGMAVSNIMNSIGKTAGLAHQLNSIKLPVIPKVTSMYTDSLLKSLTPLASITENVKGVYSDIPKAIVPNQLGARSRQVATFTPSVDFEAKNNSELKEIKLLLQKNQEGEDGTTIKRQRNTGLILNIENGDVSKNGVFIGRVKIHNMEGKFFRFLFNNLGVFKTHKEIVEGVYEGVHRTSRTDFAITSDWKRSLDTNIKNLIDNSMKGGYIIK